MLQFLKSILKKTEEKTNYLNNINLPRESFIEIVKMSNGPEQLMVELFAWYEIEGDDVL